MQVMEAVVLVPAECDFPGKESSDDSLHFATAGDKGGCNS